LNVSPTPFKLKQSKSGGIKMKSKIRLVILLLLLAFTFSSCAPVSSPKPGEESLRMVSVVGVGMVQYEPDMAVITVGVRSEFNDIMKAMEDNADKIKAIRQTLLALDVAPADVQTRNFSISSQEIYNPVPDTNTMSYVVENSVSVVVRDLDRLGELLTAAVEAGANTVFGIAFDVVDREAFFAEAQIAAIEDARQQAEAIAEVAGVELGQLYTIHMNEGFSSSPVRMAMEASLASPQVGDVPISNGMINFTATAALSFEIK
jgi:hypothetical protein